MSKGIAYTGIPSAAELRASNALPSEERLIKGPVAVIECVQEIPCNPCEGACTFHAIHIGETITDLPCLDESKCTGCGLCVAACPGLAITILNKNYSDTLASIDFPFEYLPLPQKGEIVDAVGRDGEVICKGNIVAVKKLDAYQGTCIIRMVIPLCYADEVKSMKRLTV